MAAYRRNLVRPFEYAKRSFANLSSSFLPSLSTPRRFQVWWLHCLERASEPLCTITTSFGA
jgi:hypothetical protein